MKKLILFIFIFFTSISYTYAIEATTTKPGAPQISVIATLNIYNAQIDSQNDRNFKLSFDMVNDQGVQPNIKYAVQIVTVLNGKSTLIDEYIYPEILSAPPNGVIHKDIIYNLPDSIPAGNYKLYITSKNSSNLLLASAFISDITIKTNVKNRVEIIPDSCSMTVSTSTGSRVYSSQATPFIGKDDVINIKCQMVSTFSEKITLRPFVKTQIRSSFGDIIDEFQGSQTVIDSGTNIVSITLKRVIEPQIYSVLLSLNSDDESINTNIIPFSYMVLGPMGTIRNVIFDKTAYSRGDTAKVQVFGMILGEGSSADQDTRRVGIIIKNSENKVCGQTVYNHNVPNTSIDTLIFVPIEINCINPTAQIVLSFNNQYFDSINMSIVSTEYDSDSLSGFYRIRDNILWAIILIIILSIPFIIKRRLKSLGRGSIFLSFIIFGFFSLANNASALTVQYSNSIMGGSDPCELYVNSTGNININKQNYTAGENVVVTASVSYSGGWNYYYCEGLDGDKLYMNLGINNARIDNNSSMNFSSVPDSPLYGYIYDPYFEE